MESRLGKFAAAFDCPLTSVSGTLIQKWLDDMKAGGRTRPKHLRHVSALFRFAIARKWLPKDALEEVEAVPLPQNIIPLAAGAVPAAANG